MRRTPLTTAVTFVLTGAVAMSCSDPLRPSRVAAGRSTPESTPDGGARGSWRKPRYISVEEAVDRLEAHVDVPVVLPRDRLAGVRTLRGWLADPKYLGRDRVKGVRVGVLKLRKKRKILIISYGAASFDGCGGRDVAIETRDGSWSASLGPWSSRGREPSGDARAVDP